MFEHELHKIIKYRLFLDLDMKNAFHQILYVEIRKQSDSVFIIDESFDNAAETSLKPTLNAHNSRWKSSRVEMDVRETTFGFKKKLNIYFEQPFSAYIRLEK